MFGRIRSLRTRLTLGVVVIFTAVFALLGVVTDRVRAGDLWDTLDQRLLDRATDLLEAIRVESGQVTFDSAAEEISTLNPLRFPGFFFQIVSADGEVLRRSKNLGVHNLPFDPPVKAEPRARTLPVAQARDILQAEAELRVVTLHEASEPEDFYFQVAASAAGTRASLRQLRRLILWLAGLGVVVVGLTTWFVAGRMLAPVTLLADQAAEYKAQAGWTEVGAGARGDEVGDLAHALNEMGARVDATLQSQERFVSDASHELKTPLAVVITQSQVLRQQTRTTEEYIDFLNTVEEELSQLVYLVESLLTLARADAGVPLTRKRLSVNEIVMDAVEYTSVLARHREVRLVPTLAPPTADGREALVDGDPQLLRALLQNLLRNAIRYSPIEEAIEVTVTCGEEVELVVRDHGPGIPAERLEQVFERFFRTPDAERWGEGIGIGLAMARGIVHLHGGSIRASNHPDGGAVFTVELPLAPQSPG